MSSSTDFGYDDDDLDGFHEEAPAPQRRLPEAERMAHTVTGLEAYIARRHQRVAPEARNPIAWGRTVTPRNRAA